MRFLKALAAVVAAALTVSLGACAETRSAVTIGLITKQEDNPYWVTMRDVAQQEAGKTGATLITATGTSDVDVESQRKALADMVSRGVNGVLIAPTDSTALAEDIRKAREAGVTVIAVDTPMDPIDTTDAYFGTDNRRAGELVGQYAKAKITELGTEPVVAMLNLAPGISSGEERAAGFLAGFGIGAEGVAVSADSEGDRDLAKKAMTDVLSRQSGINVVYAINEPAALGAVEALKDAGKNLADIVVVAVDGGCDAMKAAVRPGDIDAVAMQFPQNMAREGVQAIVSKVRDKQDPSGYLATGTELVSGSPAPGIASKNVEYGIRTCWG